MKKVYIYLDACSPIGGVESHVYNMAYGLKDYCEVVFLYTKDTNIQVVDRMSTIVKTEEYDEKKTYECDGFYRASLNSWDKKPKPTIISDKIAQGIHGMVDTWDAEYLRKLWDNVDNLACGKYCGEVFEKVTGKECIPIGNILLPKPEVKKVLHFIYIGRIDSLKGWDLMEEFMSRLRTAQMPFTLDIITNSIMDELRDKNKLPEEVRIWNQRYDTYNLVADADYLLLLSKAEASPMVLREALQLGTPCITTSLGGCMELIHDGDNGYIIDLVDNKLGDFDLNRLYTIPEAKEYEITKVEDWLKYFRYSKEKD